MSKLSLSEVSKNFNVSRSTLYRAIKEGRISRNSDGLFDIAEVIRCFGEPSKKNDQHQSINKITDDTDLRQLVEFMKNEIESYKDREKRYLDQIERFQLLLNHKNSEEKSSNETPVRHSTDTSKDSLKKKIENVDNKEFNSNLSYDENLMKHFNDASQNEQMTHSKTPKKRGFFGRLLKAVLDD